MKVRGLIKIAGWIFFGWGILVSIKGFLDAFWFSPESEFVPLAKWVKYAGFEIVYGLACCVVGILLFEYIKRFEVK